MYRIEANGVEIYNSTLMDTLPVTEAQQSEQLNEAGGLRFTLVHGHPKYGLLEPMASYITAYEDADVVFYGRVLDAGLPTFSGLISYECEGALSFLNDSNVTPSKNVRTMTVQEFFEWCINEHNSDIQYDSRRIFEVGQVTIPEKNKSEKFQISSYTKTKTAIENNLLNVFGGYLKVRIENGHRYLDWLEHYSSNVNQSPITIGENVIEKAFSMNGENLFTVVRPVGKNGILLDTPTIDVFPAAAITKYGRIVEPVSFSDAADKTALQTKANEYIARLKQTLLCSGSIKMVDMHYLDGSIPKVRLGDRFNNIQGLEGTEMTISSCERDYSQEWLGDFSFGNDKSLSDGSKSGGGSISKGTSRARSSSGMNFKHIQEIGDIVVINSETLDMHGQTLTQHYEMIEMTSNNYVRLSTEVDNTKQRVTTIEGTGVVQNDELLTSFAGTMRLVKDSQGHITGIQFVDGTMVAQDVNGQMVTVGKKIHDNEVGIQTIMGSSLWTQREGIVGVAGEFELHEDQQTHVKTLVIKSGGGMKVLRNNVEYGIYDNGNLTGGVVVNKINNQTQTKIKGDLINLGTDLTDQDLNTWAKNARDGEGVFAKYLTVKQLTAEEIDTMFMDADLSHLNIVNTNHLVSNHSTLAGETWIGSGGRIGYMGVNGTYPLSDLIVSASVDSDTNTLTLRPLNGDVITFRKAASGNGRFSSTWSGSIQTIAADENGYDYLQYEFRRGNMQWASNHKSGTLGIQVYRIAGANEYLENTFTLYVPTEDAYNYGWNAARNLVNNNLPLSDIGGYIDGTYKTINVKVPRTDGSSTLDSTSYTLSKNGSFQPTGSTSAIHAVELKNGNAVVARIDAESFYSDGRTAGITAGKNAVGIGTPTWEYDPDNVDQFNRSANKVTVATTGKSPNVSTSLQFYLTQQTSWVAHTKYVYMRVGSSSGAYYGKLQINATDEYNSVTVDSLVSTLGEVAPANRRGSGTLRATASNGNTIDAAFVLSRDTYTTSGGTVTPCFNLKLDGVLIGRITAQPIYDDGYSAGRNGVTVDTIACTAGAVAANTLRASGNVKATASNNKSKTVAFSLNNGTYTQSGTSHKCINLVLNGVTIGRANADASIASSNILIGSESFATGDPSGISVTNLGNIASLLRNNRMGYVYFKVSVSGTSAYKWYKIATPN